MGRMGIARGWSDEQRGGEARKRAGDAPGQLPTRGVEVITGPHRHGHRRLDDLGLEPQAPTRLAQLAPSPGVLLGPAQGAGQVDHPPAPGHQEQEGDGSAEPLVIGGGSGAGPWARGEQGTRGVG